jgi:phosphoribosylcarboxyaminoimidazole (NCAIR) mutase
MKDYIASIEAGRNITDAHRSPEQLAYRTELKATRITQAICWSIVIAGGISFGAVGFIAAFAAVALFAIGHDLGAKK